jgi:hypothetical protein
MNQEYLKSILNYDAETGLFTWKVKMGSLATIGKVAGSLHREGYICIMILGKEYKAHRLAFLYMTGSFPNIVDHINSVKNDNRWENLRECSKLENAHNRVISPLNTTGIKGVTWCNTDKCFRGNVTFKGKRYMKRFKTKEEAATYVQEMRSSLHKEFTNHGQ